MQASGVRSSGSEDRCAGLMGQKFRPQGDRCASLRGGQMRRLLGSEIPASGIKSSASGNQICRPRGTDVQISGDRYADLRGHKCRPQGARCAGLRGTVLEHPAWSHREAAGPMQKGDPSGALVVPAVCRRACLRVTARPQPLPLLRELWLEAVSHQRCQNASLGPKGKSQRELS